MLGCIVLHRPFFQHQQCNWADSCTQYLGQLVIRPAGAAKFPRRYALGLTRKWTLRNNKWDVIIITGQLLCTKHVISLKNILFLEFGNFNLITCCARNISLDFNVIQLYFEIIFNLTRNFG